MEFIIYFSMSITSLSTILYVFWTKFGKNKLTELEKLNYDNKVLKKRLKQKELKSKLNEN